MTITVNKNPTYGSLNIFSTDEFFSESVIFKDYHDRIEFTKPTLDYQGSLFKFNWYKGRYQSTLRMDFPLCKDLRCDEDDSDEDIKVFYK